MLPSMSIPPWRSGPTADIIAPKSKPGPGAGAGPLLGLGPA